MAANELLQLNRLPPPAPDRHAQLLSRAHSLKPPLGFTSTREQAEAAAVAARNGALRREVEREAEG